MIGQGEGELPIRKLRMTLMRLPRTLTGKDVNALDKRLKALTARPQMPKGAIPKNMRPPKGAFRQIAGPLTPVVRAGRSRAAVRGPSSRRRIPARVSRRAGARPGRAAVDDHRAGEPVVQAAPVLVHDQRGHDEGEQHAAQQRPEHPDPAAVGARTRSGSW